MTEFYLIRHGLTEANIKRRYAGRTDYPLLAEGKDELIKRDYGKYRAAQAVFISPLLRCRMSADIIFPEHEKTVIEDLIECDFGDFEDKSADEMKDYEPYRRWVDSGCTLPFPGGEDVEEFKDRCEGAMKEVIDICRDKGLTKAALVVHGGVIMSIMERLCTTKLEYYSWHPDNGCGYTVLSGRGYELGLINEISF